MCKVLNVRQVGRREAPDRVYVGRPSKWGNLRSCRLRVSSLCPTIIGFGQKVTCDSGDDGGTQDVSRASIRRRGVGLGT
jgi:hypothetical protein